jgi:hypothetical protein
VTGSSAPAPNQPVGRPVPGAPAAGEGDGVGDALPAIGGVGHAGGVECEDGGVVGEVARVAEVDEFEDDGEVGGVEGIAEDGGVGEGAPVEADVDAVAVAAEVAGERAAWRAVGEGDAEGVEEGEVEILVGVAARGHDDLGVLQGPALGVAAVEGNVDEGLGGCGGGEGEGRADDGGSKHGGSSCGADRAARLVS